METPKGTPRTISALNALAQEHDSRGETGRAAFLRDVGRLLNQQQQQLAAADEALTAYDALFDAAECSVALNDYHTNKISYEALVAFCNSRPAVAMEGKPASQSTVCWIRQRLIAAVYACRGHRLSRLGGLVSPPADPAGATGT